MVQLNGPFNCGLYLDKKIFLSSMKKHLLASEWAVADSGYTDRRCISPGSLTGHRQIHRRIQARHETANERVKNMNTVHHIFRHDVSKHWVCFHAVAKVTAVIIDSSDPLFEI